QDCMFGEGEFHVGAEGAAVDRGCVAALAAIGNQYAGSGVAAGVIFDQVVAVAEIGGGLVAAGMSVEDAEAGLILSCAGVDAVVAAHVGNLVFAPAAFDPVIAFARGQRVEAGAADQRIVAFSGLEDHDIGVAGLENVVALAGGDVEFFDIGADRAVGER